MGATLSAGRLASNPMSPIQKPHAKAEMLEHPAIRAIPVEPREAPVTVGFMDGIQRYSHEANLGLVPVFKAHVSAMVQLREHGRLRVGAKAEREALVAPVNRLLPEQRAELERIAPLRESGADDAVHPLVDRQRAIEEIERLREEAERAAGTDFIARHPGCLLVVDGAVTAYADHPQVVGVVKSHETQFLTGTDLDVALTLPFAHRTSVFARTGSGGRVVHTWYLRLWPWEGEDLFYGLVRVERAADGSSIAQANELSGWILSERTPLSAPDGRWDRLLYPIHSVEETLRAQVGSWA